MVMHRIARKDIEDADEMGDLMRKSIKDHIAFYETGLRTGVSQVRPGERLARPAWESGRNAPEWAFV